MASDAGWRAELEDWLRPLLEALGHPARRAMCPLYVAGPIGPGERKSVQALAGRACPPSHHGLPHFIAPRGWGPPPAGARPRRGAVRFPRRAGGVLGLRAPAAP